MARDQLFSALVAGKGDIVAANLTVTEDRQQQADFTIPLYSNVQELLLSGPGSPEVANLEQLSGKEVFVRQSSLLPKPVALNAHFAKESRPPVIIEAAPESLEDEDLIEMLSAGLIPLTVVDRHKALFWKQVFPKIEVHQDIVLRKDASIGWAVRKNSPQLLASLNRFVKANGGSKLGNTILLRYLKNAKYVKMPPRRRNGENFWRWWISSVNTALGMTLTGC